MAVESMDRDMALILATNILASLIVKGAIHPLQMTALAPQLEDEPVLVLAAVARILPAATKAREDWVARANAASAGISEADLLDELRKGGQE